MGFMGKSMVFVVLGALLAGPLAAQEAYETQGIAVTDRPLPPAFDGNKNASAAKAQGKAKISAKKAEKKKKKGSKKTKKKAKGGKKKTAVKAKKTQ